MAKDGRDGRCYEYVSEILVWQNCILWMRLGYRERYKDPGERKLEIIINYSRRN